MAISTHFVTAPYAVADITSAMLLFYNGLGAVPRSALVRNVATRLHEILLLIW